MLPMYLADIVSRVQSTQDDAQRRERIRTSRGFLLVDLMAEELDVWCLYDPTSAEKLEDLFNRLLSVPKLQRDLIAYYIVLDTSDPATAQRFIKARHIPHAHAARIQGFWHIDHDQLEEAARILSTPGPWCGLTDDDRIGSGDGEGMRANQDAVLKVLANEGTARLVNTFIQGSGMVRNSPARRECSVRALAMEDGRMGEAWRYVRDLEFEDEMVVGEELAEGEDGMDIDGEEAHEEKRVEMVREERRRLLAVILDAILLPRPHKTALQALLKLPIDNYEQKFLTSYLLNATSSLPAASFSLLHDLLTLRLCSSGQHANAIELDRQVAERIRERPELAIVGGGEARASVQAMVELLPEVQRKMLLVERDAVNTGEASKEQEGEGSVQTGSVPGEAAPYTRPSFAPLSASVQLRQASNPRNAIYQALLRSTSSSSLAGNVTSRAATDTRYLASDHAPASSRRQLNTSTAGMGSSIRVPYGGQQTQFPASPFNLPPRVPIGYAAASVYAQSAGQSVQGTLDDETYDDGSVTPREARSASPGGGFPLGESGADVREDTPVARNSRQRVEQQDGERDDEHASRSESHGEPMVVEEQDERGDDVEPEQSTKKAKATRTRKEASQPATSPPATRTIAKTPRRTRKQKEDSQTVNEDQPAAGDDHAIPIPGAFPTPTKAKRKLRSSSQFETTDGHQERETQEPRAKKTRKGVTGTEAARRATRSQSVVSQATTEADHEDTSGNAQDSEAVRRRPQRRSARLSESTAPSSPARSVASEAASTTAMKGPRTRKAAGRTPKKTAPPATRGVRTRRQAAALEEEDEE